MKRDLIIKKCLDCGAIVKVIKDCTCDNCGIKCCEKEMKELIPNSVDAAIEKHMPTYEIKDGMLIIKVDHVMESDHYIEWISIVSEKKEKTKYFDPGNKAEFHCKYIPGSTIYSYCNKHGLWGLDVE